MQEKINKMNCQVEHKKGSSGYTFQRSCSTGKNQRLAAGPGILMYSDLLFHKHEAIESYFSVHAELKTFVRKNPESGKI